MIFIIDDDEIMAGCIKRACKKETQIFPRYHQRDAIHKILADVHDN